MSTELEAEVIAGDPAAFGRFIRLHDRRFRGVAWSVVRDAHRTDDVMQTAYEKAFRRIGTYDGTAALTTWLHSIVYRTALDNLRYEGRRRHEDVDDLGDVIAIRPDAAAHAVGRMEMDAVMEGLNPGDRAALMLTAGLGFSYDEAAEILDERRGTVASRVSRARARISRWEQS
ncbi:MAG: RNA polymerase sigma factor [Actinomycetota bacterium]